MDEKRAKILSNLLISGGALIIFGILDIAKFVIYWIIDPVQFAMVKLLFEIDSYAGFLILGIGVGTLIVEFVLYLIIGLSARAEAKGKKKSLFYVVVAIILAVILVLIAIANIVVLFFEEVDFWMIFDAIISSAITIVVVYILIDIIRSSFKNRKLQKEENKTGLVELKENIKSEKEAEK